MEESAYHGLLFGSTSPFATAKDLKETILDYLRSPQLPTGAGPFRETFPHSGERDIAIVWSPEAVISLTVSDIEVAAAAVARRLDPSVTLRELANATGISERAAAARYRKSQPNNTTTEKHTP